MALETELIICYYTPFEKTFIHSESTRTNWHILAPGQKNTAFSYEFDGMEANTQLDEMTGTVQYGELLICPPGWTLRRQTAAPLEFLSIEFKWYDEITQAQHTESTQKVAGKRSIRDYPRFTSTMDKFKEKGNATFSYARQYRTHLLNDLLFLSMDELHYLHKANNRDQRIEQAVLYMEEHMDKPLSLNEIAEKALLSPSQFTRRFQSIVGIPPKQYLTDLRMHKACHLLLESDLLIDEIAKQCGYQNGFYFSRVFTKRFNLNPSKFRLKNWV